MDIKTVLAAGLDLNFDYEKIKNEILSTREFWDHSPPYDFNIDAAKQGKIFPAEAIEMYDKIDFQDKFALRTTKELRGQYIFYMRYHPTNKSKVSRFDITKNLTVDEWKWRPEIIDRTPYFKNCIESLNYNHIGCIRVFITENTFFPTHRDYGWEQEQLNTNYDACFGLSIIPDTGNVPMKIYSFATKQVHEIFGNAMLFNDSAWHGVSMVEGIRITIRVFGQINYNNFLPYLNQKYLILE